MLSFRLSTTFLLAAICLLLRAGLSKANPITPDLPVWFDLYREKVTTCDDSNNVHLLTCNTGVINECANSTVGTIDVIKRRCDGKRVCELNTNVVRTSDPCYGIYKYLETGYACLPATRVIACEHSLTYLKCDEGLVIFVLGADYGRRDKTTCIYERPDNQITNIYCSNPTSKVADSCNGKNSCIIKASNSVFGDPCIGTYKYLEVSYTCEYSDFQPQT
ncbi:hypothetical protein LDENG_00133920 [Lucifuga dentata]|nr:hypothetical protein LDENG_00133920 [Lucifuga dentata]